MAGSNIYLGNLFGAMITSIGSLVTKMDSMITKLDTQITNLQLINTSVGQSIQAGKIKASEANAVIIKAAESSQVGSTYVAQPGARYTIFAAGILRIRANIKSSNAGMTANIQYSKNGAAGVGFGSNGTISYAPVTVDVAVSSGDILTFLLANSNGAATSYIEANSLKASFDIINLATDGMGIVG
jgi:hypothetical protein